MTDIQSKAANIKLVIFDVDGVLTDGRIYLSDSGDEFKAFHAQDGMGLKMLIDAGIEVAIITARQSKLVEKRMQGLQIKHIYQGQMDKRGAYADLKSKVNISDQDIAYVGDDIIDLPILSQCGFAIAVANATPFVKANTHWQTQHSGGAGAAREVAEFILQTQQKLHALHESYLA